MKENYFLDDGTYSASQIVVEMVRRRLEGEGDISEDLLSQLSEPADSQEFRLKLEVSCSSSFETHMPNLQEGFPTSCRTGSRGL